MTKTNKYILITILCAALGVVYYAWQQQWIIISLPTELVSKQCTTCSKKRVKVYHWRNKWEHEPVELLWTNQETTNAKQLIQTTLGLVIEDQEKKKNITVERILLTHNNQQLLVFFDKSPLPKNTSIHAKHMIIESILKTLRDNGITTPSVYFLVNNQPLPDAHLDFSIAWPIQGFTKI